MFLPPQTDNKKTAVSRPFLNADNLGATVMPDLQWFALRLSDLFLGHHLNKHLSVNFIILIWYHLIPFAVIIPRSTF